MHMDSADLHEEDKTSSSMSHTAAAAANTRFSLVFTRFVQKTDPNPTQRTNCCSYRTISRRLKLLYLDCSQISEQKGLKRKMIFHPSKRDSIHFPESVRTTGRRAAHGRSTRRLGVGERGEEPDAADRRVFIWQLQRFGSESQPFSIKN